jgi:hypothetical protein
MIFEAVPFFGWSAFYGMGIVFLSFMVFSSMIKSHILSILLDLPDRYPDPGLSEKKPTWKLIKDKNKPHSDLRNGVYFQSPDHMPILSMVKVLKDVKDGPCVDDSLLNLC